jgi:arylsulfatase
VNDKDYQSPFPFNGTIDKLTVNLGPSQLAPEDQKTAGEAAAKARD